MKSSSIKNGMGIHITHHGRLKVHHKKKSGLIKKQKSKKTEIFYPIQWPHHSMWKFGARVLKFKQRAQTKAHHLLTVEDIKEDSCHGELSTRRTASQFSGDDFGGAGEEAFRGAELRSPPLPWARFPSPVWAAGWSPARWLGRKCPSSRFLPKARNPWRVRPANPVIGTTGDASFRLPVQTRNWAGLDEKAFVHDATKEIKKKKTYII